MTGIPRHLLPQIDSTDIPDFRDFLKTKNIKTVDVMVPVENLKPIQSEINQDKVESLKSNPEKLKVPVIINKDGFVIDGHHRQLAAEESGMKKIPAVLCAGSLTDIVNFAHEFDGSYVKSVHEVTTYSRIKEIMLEEIKEACDCTSDPDRYQAGDGKELPIEPETDINDDNYKLPYEKTTKLYNALKLHNTGVSEREFYMGMNVELEHTNLTHGDLKKTAIIALTHLNENPEYYSKLNNMEMETNESKKSDPCWTGYKQVGMKKKNGRSVPNCVPK